MEVQENNPSQMEGICPECGHAVDYGDSEIHDDTYVYEIYCSRCNLDGTESYSLKFLHIAMKK